MQQSYVINVNNENFNEVVLQNSKLVIVDFWAEWCQPCKIFIPILEDFAQQYKNHVIVTKVNIDSYRNLVEQYEIKSVPTILIFSKNKILSRHTGILSKEELKNILKQYIDI